MGRSRTATCIAGLAEPEDVVPFGGEQAHKAFALATGLQLLVDSLAGEELRRRPARRAAGGRSRAGVARARGRHTVAG